MCKMFELSSRLKDIINQVNDEIQAVNTELSNVDKELTDIYHYIEFNNLNAREGYKAYKDLQNCLKKRREIKNQQLLAISLKDSNLVSINNSIDKCMNSIDNHKYTARVRNDLFSNSTTESIKYVDTPSNNDIDNSIIRVKNGSFTTTFNNLSEAADFLGHTSKTAKQTCMKKIRQAIRTGNMYNNRLWTIENKK